MILRTQGLTPRAAFETFAGVQMIDVRIPTTDGREIELTRFTEPQPDPRPPPRPSQAPAPTPTAAQNHRPLGRPKPRSVVQTCAIRPKRFQRDGIVKMAQSAKEGRYAPRKS